MIDKLEIIKNYEHYINAEISSYSTMKLNGHGDIVILKSIEEVSSIIISLNKNKVKYRVIGWGANQLLPENYEGVYIKLNFNFDKSIFDSVQEKYILPASVPLTLLINHAGKFGLKGWQGLTGIPASLGGAIAMNAGTNLGEIKDIVESVTYIDKNGIVKTHCADEQSFSYRTNNFLAIGDIIVGATIKNIGIDKKIIKIISEYKEFRRSSQPLNSYTCGCVYKNAEISDELKISAGKLIDLVGLKGFRLSETVKVSTKHANFMENYNDASLKELKELIVTIQKLVKLHYGINLETEVKY